MTKSIDGLGYRVEEHRMAFLFEVDFKDEKIPNDIGPTAGVAICFDLPSGMWEAEVNDEAKLHEKCLKTVGKIMSDPLRGLGIDQKLISSIKPIGYARYMELSDNDDPMKAKPVEEPQNQPGPEDEFGNN